VKTLKTEVQSFRCDSNRRIIDCF